MKIIQIDEKALFYSSFAFLIAANYFVDTPVGTWYTECVQRAQTKELVVSIFCRYCSRTHSIGFKQPVAVWMHGIIH